MISSDKQETGREGRRVVEEMNSEGQAVELALDSKLCITKKMVRRAGSGKGQLGMHRGAWERTGVGVEWAERTEDHGGSSTVTT